MTPVILDIIIYKSDNNIILYKYLQFTKHFWPVILKAEYCYFRDKGGATVI